MSYTRLMPVLAVLISGCAAMSGQESSLGARGAEVQGEAAIVDTDRYRQAITALNDGQLDQAEAGLKQIIQTHPEFAGPWVNLALIDLKRHDTDKALKNIAKARERNPKMAQIYNVLGSIEMSKGNIRAAVDHYRHALALKEDYAYAHYNLALLHDTYYQDAKVAIRHYKRYLELTDNQDKKTAEWVLELERTSAKGGE